MEQARSTDCLSNITIESVRQDFKEWRNNKTTHKIPEQLWDKVFQLLKSTHMSIVANQFKLSYSQIKAKRNTLKLLSEPDNNVNNASDFVTVTVDNPGDTEVCKVPRLHPIKVVLKNGNVIQSEVSTDILYQLIHGDSYATD
jgi:hypothetical protein